MAPDHPWIVQYLTREDDEREPPPATPSPPSAPDEGSPRSEPVMVERVARAIWRERELSFPAMTRRLKPDALDRETGAWALVVDEARAAIRALRDPTRDMVWAAQSAMTPEKRPTPEWVSCRKKHRIRYAAMIDAALGVEKEEQP